MIKPKNVYLKARNSLEPILIPYKIVMKSKLISSTLKEYIVHNEEEIPEIMVPNLDYDILNLIFTKLLVSERDCEDFLLNSEKSLLFKILLASLSLDIFELQNITRNHILNIISSLELKEVAEFLNIDPWPSMEEEEECKKVYPWIGDVTLNPILEKESVEVKEKKKKKKNKKK